MAPCHVFCTDEQANYVAKELSWCFTTKKTLSHLLQCSQGHCKLYDLNITLWSWLERNNGLSDALSQTTVSLTFWISKELGLACSFSVHKYEAGKTHQIKFISTFSTCIMLPVSHVWWFSLFPPQSGLSRGSALTLALRITTRYKRKPWQMRAW